MDTPKASGNGIAAIAAFVTVVIITLIAAFLGVIWVGGIAFILWLVGWIAGVIRRNNADSDSLSNAHHNRGTSSNTEFGGGHAVVAGIFAPLSILFG